jgi:cellulose synthase/poly-beta-1,6-N-acetylglucosamine synthase-like glycosyltransferase
MFAKRKLLTLIVLNVEIDSNGIYCCPLILEIFIFNVETVFAVSTLLTYTVLKVDTI